MSWPHNRLERIGGCPKEECKRNAAFRYLRGRWFTLVNMTRTTLLSAAISLNFVRDLRRYSSTKISRDCE